MMKPAKTPRKHRKTPKATVPVRAHTYESIYTQRTDGADFEWCGGGRRIIRSHRYE